MKITESIAKSISEAALNTATKENGPNDADARNQRVLLIYELATDETQKFMNQLMLEVCGKSLKELLDPLRRPSVHPPHGEIV